MSELLRGAVKWFNNAKGFGFIEHESGQDVFVHYSVIQTDGFKTLKDGEEVQYELSAGDKGLHAIKVVRVNHVSSSAAETTSQPIAPNLESGLVHSAHKTAAQMIEVEIDSSNQSELDHLKISADDAEIDFEDADK
jgi:CspA family cold shock protein